MNRSCVTSQGMVTCELHERGDMLEKFVRSVEGECGGKVWRGSVEGGGRGSRL